MQRDIHADIEKAGRRLRARALAVRRAFGIGCTCPTGPGPRHHWACGVNSRDWTN